MNADEKYFKANKKNKKRLAPQQKPAKEPKADKTNIENVDEFDFSDDLLAEVFNDDVSLPSENTKIDVASQNSIIDLDDWVPPILRLKNNAKTVSPNEPSLTKTGFQSFQSSCKKPNISRFSALQSMPCLSLNAPNTNYKKNILFNSREFEEDSTLRLRFLKRDVPATKLKELSGAAQIVPLTEAPKFSGSKNWFTYGVVCEYSELRKSGSGRIDVTDLSAEPYKVRFLLFNSSFSEIGKIALGSIVCISNPTKAKPYNGKEALAVNDARQVLVAGMSRDYGLCSGKKKTGGSCNAVVNLNICRYCRFHAMTEYKHQRVAKDMKAAAAGVGLGIKSANTSSLWNAKASLASSLNPAKRNVAQLRKDKERLDRLSATSSSPRPSVYESKPLPIESNYVGPKFNLAALAASASRSTVNSAEKRKRDSLENSDSDLTNWKDVTTTSALTTNLTSPISMKMSAAKKKALLFARENGGISKEKIKVKKTEENEVKSPSGITDEFLALMKEKPRDAKLLQDAEAVERDKRFERLKVVEEIGEKLAATHEVPVRAIRCLVCKKNYHQMPMQCVMNKHGCRVVTGTKRFFECNGCRTRTTTLERLPAAECPKCGVWSWKRAGVAVDRVCSASAPLSVRGMEEKFMGSIVNDPNLSLLVPDKE